MARLALIRQVAFKVGSLADVSSLATEVDLHVDYEKYRILRP
jgi:hypothetical protein